ncbi:hypothetical protein [Afipia broomeae]|uniref:Uncharacterized protein n=1 Tax=Afipia broomeae ATCC 49717 TaxID=883078 RepID=K8P1Q9_9BRAD|nr:hypothetical protein [Afipia broomeae]EKS36532.1 hypothetical protein HMPREF9695_02950 [Afipia broomeae ATCC 49717]
MASLRTLGLLVVLIGLGAASSPMAYAEWWKLYAPKDFEECSQGAEQPGLSKDAQAKIISECDSKFAGRRKAGGGYTYFDFMQNRHFDIAGPNPTPQELKRMDQDYLAYLETNPETPTEVIDTGQALAAISNQMKPVIDQKPAVRTKATAVAVETPPAASPARVRKKDVCKDDALSCGLAKITDTVKSLKHAVLGADAGVKRPPGDLSRSRPAGGA